MQKYDEQNRIPYYADILILAGLFILGQIVFNYLGAVLASALYGLEIMEVIYSNYDFTRNEGFYAFMMVQAFASFGAFIASSWAFMQFRRFYFLKAIQLNAPKSWFFILILPLLFIALTALVSQLLIFSQWLSTQPGWGEIMKKETGSPYLDKVLNWMKGPDRLMLCLVVMALIPAITEEVFFRGVLQKLCIGSSGKPHTGIIVTSLIFAAIHFNWMQLLPMFVLALALGYSYYFSGSILVPIILHFLNNTSAVLINYYSDRYEVFRQLADDKYSPSPMYLLVSLIIVIAIFFRFNQIHKKEVVVNE